MHPIYFLNACTWSCFEQFISACFFFLKNLYVSLHSLSSLCNNLLCLWNYFNFHQAILFFPVVDRSDFVNMFVYTFMLIISGGFSSDNVKWHLRLKAWNILYTWTQTHYNKYINKKMGKLKTLKQLASGLLLNMLSLSTYQLKSILLSSYISSLNSQIRLFTFFGCKFKKVLVV